MYERNVNGLPVTGPQLGTWPATMTGNQTVYLSVCRMTPNPLRHTSPDTATIIIGYYYYINFPFTSTL